ncbi:hypothetical protein PR048_030550 [Dryococelus australis]|uniref:Uncharacterized protein n=1 Tax=Dryococelus australis TaxID=614101 RepID=A0ABQ9G9A8_9NEOP|nr:hypothetical protein PR048_030550 [Dryococelus australis]
MYARLHHRGSKLDPRSDLRSTQKTVAPFEFRAGLEIEMKFISRSAAIVYKCRRGRGDMKQALTPAAAGARGAQKDVPWTATETGCKAAFDIEIKEQTEAIVELQNRDTLKLDIPHGSNCMPYLLTPAEVAAAKRLACSPHTKTKRAQSPVWSLPDFRKWESCRMIPLAGGFLSGISPFPQPLRSGAASFSHRFTLIGSQDLVRTYVSNIHPSWSKTKHDSSDLTSFCIEEGGRGRAKRAIASLRKCPFLSYGMTVTYCLVSKLAFIGIRLEASYLQDDFRSSLLQPDAILHSTIYHLLESSRKCAFEMISQTVKDYGEGQKKRNEVGYGRLEMSEVKIYTRKTWRREIGAFCSHLVETRRTQTEMGYTVEELAGIVFVQRASAHMGTAGQPKGCIGPRIRRRDIQRLRETGQLGPQFHEPRWETELVGGHMTLKTQCSIAHLIGPHLLPRHLIAPAYRVFLRDILPELPEDAPLAVRQHVWVQHNGAPAHFTAGAR